MSNDVGSVFAIKLYSEVCCDMCNEIIHNHFDCPVCGEDYAGTSLFGEIYEDDSFSCENCGACFVEVNGENLHYGRDAPLKVKRVQ